MALIPNLSRAAFSEFTARRYRRYYTYIEPIITDPVIRSYFSLVASLILVAFLLIFALSPTIDTIIGLQKKISDQKDILGKLQTKTEDLIAAQESFRQVESSIPVLLVALPENSVPQTVITQIMSSASPSGATPTSLRFSELPVTQTYSASDLANHQKPPTNDLKLPMLDFSLSLIGSPAQVRSYLGKLEDSLRYVRFQSLLFNINPDNPNIVSADAQGVGYYYIQNSQ